MKQAWENGIYMCNLDMENVRTNRLLFVNHNHYSLFWYIYMVRSVSNIIKLSTQCCELRVKLHVKYTHIVGTHKITKDIAI